jgi:O-acetylhomoserine (thiol)-lyase
MIGLDTLALRMERHVRNARAVASFLQGRKELAWLNSPGLPESSSHATAVKQLGNDGFCGLMTFGLGDRETCFRFIENLQMIYNLANLGDCKTLVLHPHSSQYLAFDEPTRQMLSIHPDLVRLSVGIEAAEDICDDLGQALDKL